MISRNTTKALITVLALTGFALAQGPQKTCTGNCISCIEVPGNGNSVCRSCYQSGLNNLYNGCIPDNGIGNCTLQAKGRCTICEQGFTLARASTPDCQPFPQGASPTTKNAIFATGPTAQTYMIFACKGGFPTKDFKGCQDWTTAPDHCQAGFNFKGVKSCVVCDEGYSLRLINGGNKPLLQCSPWTTATQGCAYSITIPEIGEACQVCQGYNGYFSRSGSISGVACTKTTSFKGEEDVVYDEIVEKSKGPIMDLIEKLGGFNF